MASGTIHDLVGEGTAAVWWHPARLRGSGRNRQSAGSPGSNTPHPRPFVRHVEALLRHVHPQHALQSDRRAAPLLVRVVRLDRLHHRGPGRNPSISPRKRSRRVCLRLAEVLEIGKATLRHGPSPRSGSLLPLPQTRSAEESRSRFNQRFPNAPLRPFLVEQTNIGGRIGYRSCVSAVQCARRMTSHLLLLSAADISCKTCPPPSPVLFSALGSSPEV